MTPTRPRRLAMNLMGTDRLGSGGFATVLECARVADDLGVDLLVLPDHVVVHGGARDSRTGFPYPIEANWYEPLVGLAAVAAVTRSCRLGMNALIAPLRPAVLLAKQLATLDAISGGRVEATLGVGWQAEEYAAAERVFEGRFGMLDEQIDACRALWRGGRAAHAGARIEFDDLHAYPLPPQGEQLPVFLALGLTERGRERILRHGAGWAPAPLPIAEFRDRVAFLAAASGDTRVRITAAVTLPSEVETRDAAPAHPLEEALALWEAGAETVIVHPSSFVDAAAGLTEFLAPLLAARDAAHASALSAPGRPALSVPPPPSSAGRR